MPKSIDNYKPKKKSLESKLLGWIDSAEKYQRDAKWVKTYKRMKQYLKGNYGKSGYENKYIVNTFYNLENIIMPNLYYKDPYIRVKPCSRYLPKKNKEGEYVYLNSSDSAAIMEKSINKLYRVAFLGRELHQCIQDALEAGFGIMKVGFYQKTETQQDIGYLDESGEIYGQRVHPLDFLYDPMATSIEDARYVIHRISKPLSEVKDNENYKNTKDLRGECLNEMDFRKEKKEDSGDQSDWITLYEIHGTEEKKIYTVVKQPSKTSKKREVLRILWERDNDKPYVGSDFVQLKFLSDTDCFEGVSPLAMIEDEALAINETLSLMVKHLQRFPGVFLYEDGSIGEIDLDNFAKGRQGEMLKVNQDAMRSGRIQRMSPLSMGQEYFGVLNTLQALVDRILGVPDFQRASYGGKRKSATEVVAEQNDSSVRRSYLVNFVKDFVLNIVDRIAAIYQEYGPDEIELDMGGDLGYEWIKIKRDAITDYRFLYDLDVNELRVYSASTVQNLINFMNVMAQNPMLQPVLQELDPKEIAKKIAEGLDINLDSIKKNKQISHVEHDPHQENLLAREGKRVPDPSVGEPHEQHMQVHQQEYLKLMQDNENKKADELFRHMEMTYYLQQVEGQLQGNQTSMQALAAGAPSATTAPSNRQETNPAGAGPSEAEAARGFKYNTEMPQ